MQRPALPHDIDAYIARQPLARAVELVRVARWHYYNTDDPIMSDRQFDALLERVEAFDPEHPVLTEVGAEPAGGAGRPRKVALPFPMPSLGKIKPDRGAERWLAKQSWVLASDKLDGISALHERSTDTPRLLSRGRGVNGQDISGRIPTTRKLGRLQPGQAVRGELIFTHRTFAAQFADRDIGGRVYKNPRNLMSGVVNTARAHPAAAHAVFIAYAQLNPPLRLDRAAAALRRAGYAVVPHRRFESPTLDTIVDYHNERKAAAPYDIDGLVLVGSDGSQIAFKMDADSQRVAVETINWKLSQFGVYKPTVKLAQAVRIGGVDVQNPTGHNARWLIERGIGPGAVVEIIRSGDVIPKIVGVVKRTKPNLPPGVRWDANRVNIVPRALSNAQARLAQVRRMETGLRVLGIEGVRETSVDKLYAVGLTDLPALFRATVPQILGAGLGTVFTRKLMEALDRAARTATHPRAMQASGVWPTGFTTTRFEPLNARLPWARMVRADRARLTAAVARQPGWSAKTAATFVAHLDAYAEWLARLPFTPRDVAPKAVQQGPLSGTTWVFTKVRDPVLQQFISDAGGVVGSSVSRNTTGVISAAPSEKTRRAEALGIPVYTLEAARQHIAQRAGRSFA